MARLKFPGVGDNSLPSQSPKKRLVLKIRKKNWGNPDSLNVDTKQEISREEFNKIFGDSDEEVRDYYFTKSFPVRSLFFH